MVGTLEWGLASGVVWLELRGAKSRRVAVLAQTKQLWTLWWVAIGLGNTVLFFMILFLVIRAATRR